MTTTDSILFKFGMEGGEAAVFKLSNNNVLEKGSSGGFLDEEEEETKNWEEIYENWEAWWLTFTSRHQDAWIFFHPLIIHEEIKKFIVIAVNKYQLEHRDSYNIDKWKRILAEKNQN